MDLVFGIRIELSDKLKPTLQNFYQRLIIIISIESTPNVDLLRYLFIGLFCLAIGFGFDAVYKSKSVVLLFAILTHKR